ncbi:hypothetical protein F2Q69_00036860 [Brassica cretica]|uniref:Uncharacterized protein n=1 Tax=Brassica cretica TaxID=69181 RepID=A0A8S9SFY2_BRACR|nr:hypothetical protein F2Q69_00036860 [Brassica cretica]
MSTCLAVLETTRKLNCYSHQILQVWSVQSAKKRAPHRSTTTPVRRSISFNHRRPERYMPSSTRNNKETQLLFSPDPASLERSIRKEARSSSIDNNTCSSLDFVQPPSTKTLVPSTDTRSPPSIEDTHLPSTDIVHPTSIDTLAWTSTDTEPRDMVATLILVRDERGDLHDQEGHMRNAAGQRIDARGCNP